jgi:UDP-GlcNAc:undecaprenyl-phosphate GlcNAc-1-phosphate transferase
MSVKFVFFPYHGEDKWWADLHLMRGIYAILLGGFVSLVLGLVDDARALSPAVKLFGQIAGAALLTLVGLRIRFVGNEALSIVLTIFWVVAITNAMNFIDIMDGLAAGVAAVAAAGFFVFSTHAGMVNNSLAAAALAGACLGFVVFNFSPARIYMGDAGSHFLGFTLSAIAINLRYSHENILAVFTPLIILALPIFDVILMTVIRSKKGIRPWHGSPDHIPLRLKALGWPVPRVVITLWAATAVLTLVAWNLSFLSDRMALLAWAAIGFSGIGLAVWLMGIVMPHDLQPKQSEGRS